MPGFNDDDDKSKSNQGGFGEESTGGDQLQPFFQLGDRVFATPEELSKHIENSQAHIKTLEQEAAERKAKIEKLSAVAEDNTTIREVLQELKGSATQPKDTEETPSLSQEELVAETVKIARTQLKEELKSDAQVEVERQNLDAAMEAAREAYGEDFNKEVVKLGKELKLTPTEINNLAKQSPLAFKRAFLPETKVSKGPTDSSYNSQSFNDKGDDGPKGSIMRMVTVNDRAAMVQAKIAAKEKQAG
jgi:hypothetical protein